MASDSRDAENKSRIKTMTFAAQIYADKNGNTYGAKDTEQRGSKSVHGRTVRGEAVEYAGQWFGSQMSYSPFRRAVAAAAAKAASVVGE